MTHENKLIIGRLVVEYQTVTDRNDLALCQDMGNSDHLFLMKKLAVEKKCKTPKHDLDLTCVVVMTNTFESRGEVLTLQGPIFTCVRATSALIDPLSAELSLQHNRHVLRYFLTQLNPS